MASFARAYVKEWGDIDVASFPHRLEQPLAYDDTLTTRTPRPWRRVAAQTQGEPT